MDKVIEKLKKDNIRITPQRQEMILILKNSQEHVTADEIYKKLVKQFPSVSIATVYNNLKLFVNIGFVKELQFGEGLSKFEWLEKDHYHIICSDCGKIEDFYYPQLKEVESFAKDLTKFNIKKHHLLFYGLCKNCSEQQENNNE